MLVLTVFLYPLVVSAQEQRPLNLMPVPANSDESSCGF
jgi:hypothetical protein